jgi:hypothetical protein
MTVENPDITQGKARATRVVPADQQGSGAAPSGFHEVFL